ncbi:hypothetical protein ACIBI9_51895 [Nonomuraea sp. NPDC050451]|uniref:hypothetical protein n=1 Tax=Nonomuraea sp. NPDC050451 TaxID=3364364 RepID=UPI0037A204B2
MLRTLLDLAAGADRLPADRVFTSLVSDILAAGDRYAAREDRAHGRGSARGLPGVAGVVATVRHNY